METIDTGPTWKENLWNIESPMSKLREINTILEPTDWDKFWVKIAKKNISQLLIDRKYSLFQEKIGMPHKLCDGLLWQKTLDYLIRYIIEVEDEAEDSIWETIRHIGEIFKFWKTTHHTESNNLLTETPKDSTTKKITPESPKINTIKKATPKPSKITSENTNTITIPMFWTTPLSKIKSYPVVKSEESESYCCSKTARLNGLSFWVQLPRGNAYTAWIFPTTWSIGTIPKEKARQRPEKTWDAIEEEKFNSISNKANFADIYAWSSTTYGHRAIAIRDSQWKRYLLDPYIKIDGKTRLTPIKLGDYIKKWRKIVKAHFYHSNWYIN